MIACDELDALAMVDAYLPKPSETEGDVLTLIQTIDRILRVDQAA